MVKMDAMEVHTTNCPANVPSLSISWAIIALDTATGVPKSAINAGYTSALKSIKEVKVDKVIASPMAIVGTITTLASVPIAICFLNSFTAAKSNCPPRIISAKGELILDKLFKVL